MVTKCNSQDYFLAFCHYYNLYLIGMRIRLRFIMRIKKTLLYAAFLSCASHASAFNLTGTVFDTYAQNVGIEPELLYAVALAESAKATSRGKVSPSCLAIRGEKPYYPSSLEQAKKILDDLLPYRSSVDIGCMQVNWRWHGHRVNHAYDLLDPNTNIRLAATILKDALDSVPNDQVLGIGRYHHWDISSEDGYQRAYEYGLKVVQIWNNLRDLLR